MPLPGNVAFCCACACWQSCAKIGEWAESICLWQFTMAVPLPSLPRCSATSQNPYVSLVKERRRLVLNLRSKK